MNARTVLSWLLACFATTFCGCGEGRVSSSPGATTALKSVSAEKLGVETVYLPGKQDGGRVEIASPSKWHRASRSQRYLALFLSDRSNAVPRILVTAADVPFDGFEEVNAENVEQFSRQYAVHLADKELVEPVKPMIIGGVATARYVVAARRGTLPVRRQILVTQFDGREYTIDLTVYPGHIERYRDASYAVLASLRFHHPDQPGGQPEKAPASTPPEN